MRPCRATPELRQKELERNNAARRAQYADPVQREKRLAANREWKKANKLKVNALNNQRKERVRSAPGHYTHDDLALILSEQGNKCPGCLVEFNGVTPTIDHFVAIAQGGTNAPENIQLLCHSCNCSKKDKPWSEWANGNY